MTIFKAFFISLFFFTPGFTRTGTFADGVVAERNATITCRDCSFIGFGFIEQSTFFWTGPGNTLPNGRYTLESRNSTLTIINVTACDEGYYTCHALHVPTKEFHQHRYTIIIGEAAPCFLTVKDGPYNVNVTEGDSVTFNCNTAAKPEAKIVWLKDGRVIDPNFPPARFAFSNGNKSLTIRDVCRNCSDRESKTDLMDIQCNASNFLGYAFASGFLNVFTVPRFPTLKDAPYDVNVTEGDSVTFNCNASAHPEAKIVWLQDGREIDPNFPPKRFAFSNGNKSLTIRDVCRNCSDRESKTDLMDIQCNASNVLGYAFASGFLNVFTVPSFPTVKDGPYDVNVTEGDSIAFSCNASAHPEAKIVWLQDGREIDTNYPPARFAFSKDNKSLTIRDVCLNCSDRENKTDLTVLQCNASNFLGYAFASGYLNVLHKTSVVVHGERYVVVKENSDKQIKWTCNATSDPSTPPSVRWYRVENNEAQPVQGAPPTVTIKEGTLTIHVHPNSEQNWKNYQGEYRCIGDNGYSKSSASVNIVEVENKLPEKYCGEESDAERSILWNRIIAGIEISQPCPGKTIGFCSRKCLLNTDGNAVWSQPNYNSCVDKEYKELLDKANDFVANASLNPNEVANIASQLSVLTNESKGLTAGNLNASVMVINRLAVFRNVNNNPNEDEINSTVQAISNILQPNNSKSWKALQAVNSSVAMAVLFSADVYAQSLSTINKSNHSTNIAGYMVLEAWSLQKPNLSLQLEFPSGSFWSENNSDSISIFVETLDNSIASETKPTLNIWGSYYRTINDYLPGKNGVDIINSRVLSLSIGGLNTKEKLKRPVLITLQHNQAERISYRRTCAFWNFERGGEWDSTGCSVTSTNFTHTICSCDHLTNFAILMSLKPSYDKVLSVISIIGCSISVIGLILTVIIYAVTWKQSRSSQATVLLNLCVALIIAYIIFMAGADKVASEKGCKAVAVLLHYFFLASFFIMLAEGVQLLLYVIFVFHVRRTIETILLVVTAWVLPLIIVGVSAGSTQAKGYGINGQACWLSEEEGLMWSFIGPVLCIITANFVILAIVLRQMCLSRAFLAKNKKKKDEMRATIWNISVTCPVLGLGWLFGLLSVAFSSVVFQYLFVIANSLQGLLIFIFHGLYHNKKMSQKIFYIYSNYICRCRDPDSSQLTLSQDPPETSPKPGFADRTVQYFERIEAHYYSSATQNTSISNSSTLESSH